MNSKGLSHYIEYAIYYILVFFILCQWLIPVMELTNTGRLNLLLVFIALCLVIYYVNLPTVIAWILKLGYIGWFVMHVYSRFVPYSREALSFLIEDTRYNISALFQMEWSYVTNPFRTTLFFVLIWMLLYLIHHWIHIRMTIFYFLILTVIFIGTLDTFTTYDGKQAIIEVVILGLILTAMLYMKRLVLRTDKIIEGKYYIMYMLPTLFFVLLFGTIAYMLPKAEPQWPDPVPFIKNLSGKGPGDGGATAVVGYSEDDSVLGGPFSANDELVFTIKTKTKQYWRIESREIYTSRGWETMEQQGISEFPIGSTIYHSLNIGAMEEVQNAIIEPHTNYNFVLQPYGTVSVNSDTQPHIILMQDPITEKITVRDEEKLNSYNILFSEPEYSYTDLKASRLYTYDMPQYLQLPTTLPERVRQLAQEITVNNESAYDKARAIQSYFSRSGFRYETNDVPIPKDGQDYVDQFLFETKFGYCDNFSTAMVVMLRAIDIPARWVKGFTGGTEVRSDMEGMRAFEITNNNAHSWVEAYIDGVGWMPFEPTIGYVSPADIAYDVTADNEADPQILEQQEQERLEREEQQLKEEEQPVQDPKAATGNREKPKWLAIVVLAVVMIIGLIVLKRRRKWLPKVYVQMQKNVEMDEVSFEKAYERLLKQLALVGLKRYPDQTLASFAKVVDKRFDTKEMQKLTEAYERVIYSRDNNEIDFSEMKEIWEYLINRTMS